MSTHVVRLDRWRKKRLLEIGSPEIERSRFWV